MKISIFGLGYVGAVSLACLARDGHHVTGVDVDAAKLDLIRAGKTPVVEEGMVELMHEVVRTGRVTITHDAALALHASDLSLICVGTPSAPNGSQDQSAMLRVAEDMGRALRDKKDHHVFVFRSTLVPGTVEDVLEPILERESGKRAGVDFSVCFQPEFLREGSSIRDYDRPPFTIVGANDDVAAETVRRVFGHLPCEFLRTSVRAAEMVKYCSNNFHALKITFANEVARVCSALHVDPFEVMHLVCEDRQLNISPAYLKPGFAFGGSCLPKDLRAITYLARQHDVEVPLLASIMGSNRQQVEVAIAKVLATQSRRVALIGLSFKTGTDDLRESPLVLLAEQLIGKGVALRVHDPEVELSRLLGANRRFIDTHVPHIGELLHGDLAAVIAQSEVIVLGLARADVIASVIEHVEDRHTVIDLVGVPRPSLRRGRWEGLCW